MNKGCEEMKRILLPVDGSESCQKSFETAKDLALKFDAEVIVLTVTTPYEQIFHGPSNAYQSFHDENYHALAERIISTAIGKFNDTGVKVKSAIEDGYIGLSIIDYAEKEEVDLIIMCTHGMGGLKRFTLGSVTHKVVMHATVPVLVIR